MKKFITLLTLLCSLIITTQGMAYSLSLSPQSQIINLGETTTLDVNLLLNPGEVLFGFNFALAYDPAVLKFENLYFNSSQLQDYLTGFTPPTAQNPNLVTFDGALAGAIGQNADLTPLASLSFTGLSAGMSSLSLEGSVLDFNGSSEIPLSASGSIAPVPEPGTWMLIGSSLAGLSCLRRRFGILG